jgi:glycine/D-amino acid oxidase-like deaminating enzyme
MSESSATEVVILDGGIVGCTTAYYLAREGVRATIIERDTVADHSSGFALGGLNPLGDIGIPDQLGQLSLESFRLHAELATALPFAPCLDKSDKTIIALTPLYLVSAQTGQRYVNNEGGSRKLMGISAETQPSRRAAESVPFNAV